MYRRFIDSGRLVLKVNSHPVAYSPADVLVAPRYNDPTGEVITWRKEFSLQLDANHQVHGWAALRERASTTEAGFAVFRRDRLIMGGADDPYRPQEVFGTPNKYAFQRLFGELSVDGFQVTHTKDGLQWEEWEPDILEWLRAELDESPFPSCGRPKGSERVQDERRPSQASARERLRAPPELSSPTQGPSSRRSLLRAPTHRRR